MSLHVNYSEQTLEITLQGTDEIVRVETSISIPLAHVKLPIEVHPTEATTILNSTLTKDLPGTSFTPSPPFPPEAPLTPFPPLHHFLPQTDIYTTGPFFAHGTSTFFSMRHPDRTIAVNIDHSRYRKFVLEVEAGKTPEHVRDEITHAVEEALEWDRIHRRAKEENDRLEAQVVDAL
ncbi:hypothetical protein BC938DRAFT_482600 [Jimgerdemannia flammicorona]|uniref:Uncharacterized protein n=1 Tax=Jimgerdemannia flammicorona TaxID=994334 RepID=A0A433QDR0_9FUNG|nr:hypothetical protein BC938DRAFT_482600 [Jimgerdemannia flammicorona]